MLVRRNNKLDMASVTSERCHAKAKPSSSMLLKHVRSWNFLLKLVHLVGKYGLKTCLNSFKLVVLLDVW